MSSTDPLSDLVRANAPAMMVLAKAHSLCADDAQDAFQRTIEIYLERANTVREATAANWLKSVCKHEAMRLRRARQRLVPDEEVEWDGCPSPDLGELHERAAARERVAYAREALRACSPEERQAILLKADGASYVEIAARCDWSYTKVNRLLARGRARFLHRYAAIETGRACAAYRLVLTAIVDGEASIDDFMALRPHLRHCAACRGELMAIYDAERALTALRQPETAMSG